MLSVGGPFFRSWSIGCDMLVRSHADGPDSNSVKSYLCQAICGSKAEGHSMKRDSLVKPKVADVIFR